MGRNVPTWLQETSEFCRNSGIKIVAGGADCLIVEAKSADHAQEIASQLSRFGFQVIKNEEDDSADLLTLSKNPSAVQAQIAVFPISRRPLGEQIIPLIWLVCSLVSIPCLIGNVKRYVSWCLLFGGGLLIMFLRDGARIWGWKLEINQKACVYGSTGVSVRFPGTRFTRSKPLPHLEEIKKALS